MSSLATDFHSHSGPARSYSNNIAITARAFLAALFRFGPRELVGEKKEPVTGSQRYPEFDKFDS